MPRFITVTLGCDWPECQNQGEDGDDAVVSKTLSVDGRQGRTFLICKQHRDYLDEIHAPLLAAGVKVEVPKRTKTSTAGTAPSTASTNGEAQKSTGVECLSCGRTDIKNRAGMAQHVMRSHGFESLAAYEAEYDVHLD